MRNPIPIPHDAGLRRFSAITIGVCLVLFAVVTFTIGRGFFWWTSLEIALWSFFGLVYPFFVIPLYWGLGVIGKSLEWLLYHVAAALVFYLYFTPLALLRGKPRA